MDSNYSKLQITDNIPNLGDGILREEITLLAPYLMDKVMAINKATDERADHNQSRPLQPR
jgi:hypothetical protein